MFIIQYRNRATGEWYDDYKTDNYPNACAYLGAKSRGKAGRIIDTHTGAIRDTVKGDIGAYDRFDKDKA